MEDYFPKDPDGNFINSLDEDLSKITNLPEYLVDGTCIKDIQERNKGRLSDPEFFHGFLLPFAVSIHILSTLRLPDFNGRKLLVIFCIFTVNGFLGYLKSIGIIDWNGLIIFFPSYVIVVYYAINIIRWIGTLLFAIIFLIGVAIPYILLAAALTALVLSIIWNAIQT
jgi:hypothetical protein